ncbi:hypothetical protein HYPSUDRAFT_280784 [Hypholoma sublateritium FD-334 SS-4]|uniref:Uncharacterized protein n=1 Tax=Hypholoma sublateritium (strain FD-334 SS-4) TaxID=945553 RepID=A0A0D2LGA4_HYPSF|nr:hypothetical protein HYPSUDRAFT_280784 [Hypholoma sublateritium FD-334 SS-4]
MSRALTVTHLRRKPTGNTGNAFPIRPEMRIFFNVLRSRSESLGASSFVFAYTTFISARYRCRMTMRVYRIPPRTTALHLFLLPALSLHDGTIHHGHAQFAHAQPIIRPDDTLSSMAAHAEST